VELVDLATSLKCLFMINLSEKVKTSMAALKKQGKFVGGHAPFGYIKDPSDK